MAHAVPFMIGADVGCTDGACGEVSRLIVNPVAREVTHVVVDPKHQRGLGRMVPVDLVDATTGQLRLSCTLAEYQALPPAAETEAVPDLDPTGHAGYAADRASLPSFLRRLSPPAPPREVTVDAVPSGAVDVRPGLVVRATDGEIGQVRGLLVEPGGHQVTHVLLQKAPGWRRKEVAIPIGAVTKIGTMLIQLSITKRQVEHLPPRGH
jgi:sporulation protein YlmC with PRC-barrel domain